MSLIINPCASAPAGWLARCKRSKKNNLVLEIGVWIDVVFIVLSFCVSLIRECHKHYGLSSPSLTVLENIVRLLMANHSSLTAKSHSKNNKTCHHLLIYLSLRPFIFTCNYMTFPAPSVDYLFCFLEKLYVLFRQLAAHDVIVHGCTYPISWPDY